MVNGNIHTCVSCVHGWGNFTNLTKDQLNRINENRFEAIFTPGEIIFKEGTPASDAVFLSTGLGKIFMNGFDGKRIILNIAQPRQLLLGPGFFVDNRHHYSVSALTEVKACFINANLLKELVNENPTFAEGFLRDISKKSLYSHNRLISLLHRKMHGRLAEGLIQLSESVFKKTKFSNLLSRQELGELTGMTKESVVRILKEFDQDKIIQLEPNQIEILDIEKLRRIMQTG